MVNFKPVIGMKFSEIETVIKQYGKENEAAAKSIFNMIKDEKEYGGDMEISNLNELRMITDWMKSLFPGEGNKPNKDVDVQMPDSLAKAQPKAAAEGKTIKGIMGEQELTYDGYSHKVEYELEDGRQVVDTFYDKDGDGVADERVVEIKVKDEKGLSTRKTTIYTDYDLDGQFDERDVWGMGEDSWHVRGKNGKWQDQYDLLDP